ncbi:MAG: CoA-binding protein [Ignavibacteriales bacterium]|nr:CoA-binding protein [Ignavibacteriales bacterium]
MISKKLIDGFLEDGIFAIVGISRSGKKFGNVILKELSGKGYTLHPVHPSAGTIDGFKCHNNISAIPENVKSLIIAVKPDQSKNIIREAAQSGIKKVWFQQGSSSTEVLEMCSEYGIEAIHGECILMFVSQQKFPHNFHKFIWKLLGKYPQ